nr:MAG TPA: hypothetical protein [Caudoviricetes sp.]
MQVIKCFYKFCVKIPSHNFSKVRSVLSAF